MVIQIAVAVNLHQLRGNNLSAAGNLFIPRAVWVLFQIQRINGMWEEALWEIQNNVYMFRSTFFFTLFITGKPAESCPKSFRTCTQIFIPFVRTHMYAVACE